MKYLLIALTFFASLYVTATFSFELGRKDVYYDVADCLHETIDEEVRLCTGVTECKKILDLIASNNNRKHKTSNQLYKCIQTKRHL